MSGDSYVALYDLAHAKGMRVELYASEHVRKDGLAEWRDIVTLVVAQGKKTVARVHVRRGYDLERASADALVTLRETA